MVALSVVIARLSSVLRSIDLYFNILFFSFVFLLFVFSIFKESEISQGY